MYGTCSEDMTVNPEEQRARTFDAVQGLGLSLGEVWLRYLGLGGDVVDEYEVNAYLYGLIQLPDFDRDLISIAVDELYDEVWGESGAPFRRAPRSNSEDT
jgi:hypothetical protein